jgi:hypothetical protein
MGKRSVMVKLLARNIGGIERNPGSNPRLMLRPEEDSLNEDW